MRVRKASVTGGAGFIGSHVVRRLLESGVEVTIIDNFQRPSITKEEYASNPAIHVAEADIRNEDALRRAVKGCHMIVHCAAVAGINTVGANIMETMEINVLGTANLLKAARSCGELESLVCISTSEVFGPDAYKRSDEEWPEVGAPGQARWMYGASKVLGEHLAVGYYEQIELPVVVLRPFNIYGPGQVGEGALRNFIQSALKNEPLKIFGDGSQVRAWCYIDDFVDAVLAALEEPSVHGKCVSVGNPRATRTIRGLAELVVDVLQSKSDIVHGPALDADVSIRVPDISRAVQHLGFEPRIGLSEGIARTADTFASKL